MHMQKPTTKPRKRREEQIKPTNLTKEKLATKRGNKPKLPSQASKSLKLKWFGEDIYGLPLGWYMDHVYVASLMVISHEV